MPRGKAVHRQVLSLQFPNNLAGRSTNPGVDDPPPLHQDFVDLLGHRKSPQASARSEASRSVSAAIPVRQSRPQARQITPEWSRHSWLQRRQAWAGPVWSNSRPSIGVGGSGSCGDARGCNAEATTVGNPTPRGSFLPIGGRRLYFKGYYQLRGYPRGRVGYHYPSEHLRRKRLPVTVLRRLGVVAAVGVGGSVLGWRYSASLVPRVEGNERCAAGCGGSARRDVPLARCPSTHQTVELVRFGPGRFPHWWRASPEGERSSSDRPPSPYILETS